jgi:hypothetical protein
MNEQQPQQRGKGDTQRPFNGETFRANYDNIFRSKNKKPTKEMLKQDLKIQRKAK